MAAVGEPPTKWPGRCHEIACAINQALRLGWKEEYGGYYGTVNPGGLFTPGKAVHRHGWLRMPDDRIFDPTRWVFEVVEPYIYVGPDGGDYDLGMERLNAAFRQGQEPPGDDAHPKKLDFTLADADAALFVSETFDSYPTLNLKQLGYLANLGPRELGRYAAPIYKRIVELGHRAFIPIDYRVAVLGNGKYSRG